MSLARSCVRRLSGMLWSKQFYHYDCAYVADRRSGGPTPPEQRLARTKQGWTPHLYNDGHHFHARQVGIPVVCSRGISAFHCVSLAVIDPDFAKDQLFCCCANGT